MGKIESKFLVVATQIFFMFTPKFGEDEPNLTCMFQRGWLKPPTRNFLLHGPLAESDML